MNYRLSPYLKAIVVTTGIFSALAGIFVILGWIYNVPFLKSLNPGYISMKPNTALCFIFIGIPLLILSKIKISQILKNIARILLIIVLLFSAVTIFEYMFVWNAGIDELLMKEGPGTTATIYPGRMAESTAFCFILLSLALLVTDNRFSRDNLIAQLIALTTGLICILPQLGYAYKEPELFTFISPTPMALNTSITIFIISIGVFFMRPSSGLLKVLSSDGIGGIFARRLFPVIIVLPILFIWVRLAIETSRYELKTIDFGIISILYIGLFLAVQWKTIKSLNNLDLIRRKSEKQLLIAKEETEQNKSKLEAIFNSVSEGIAVADMNGFFFLLNPAQARISGYSSVDEMKKNNSYFLSVYELSYQEGRPVPVDEWPISKVLRGESVSDYILKRRRHDTGQEWVFSFSGEPVMDEKGKQILAVLITRDITENKRRADNENLAHQILNLLNDNEDSEIMITKVIQAIKDKTGIEAVALRLKQGEDFPYFKTQGFSKDFVETERYICTYDEKGNIERKDNGAPVLECMCGNILCGRIDSTKPFFSRGGSFMSNNTTHFLATTTPEERLTSMRNRCNSSGYESVALIPIRSATNIIGLLQLNDHRLNVFNEETVPFFEGLGKNIGIAIMRKKAEADLKRSEWKYRKIFESFQDIFYQIDKQGLISEISPSVFRIAGYRREELIGNPSSLFYFDSEERNTFLNLLSKKGEIWDFEIRMKTKSGKIKYASLNSHLLFDSTGQQIGIEGTLRDIDERKLFENQLKESKEKAEESDRLKTAFLQNISHEIRTPMNAILGFSSMLGLPGTDADTQASFIKTIQANSNQLHSIINDIVDISSIEANLIKKHVTNFNLNTTLKNLYARFSLKTSEKNIALNLKVGLSDDQAMIQTDNTKLIQILSSLLMNSVKFTKQGNIEFGYTLNKEMFVFFVSDTGIGIHPENHSKIFDTFFQVEKGLSRQFGGTGLGLSISKAYVELLGGKIWLESEPDKGTIFYFNIPVEPADQLLKGN
jgi:PAS domain S-box-containing protein